MPERTQYAPGTPSWIDLQTTDQDGAKKFYGAMFGWDYDDQPVGRRQRRRLFDGDEERQARRGDRGRAARRRSAALEHVRDGRRCRRDRRAGSGRGRHGDDARRST